MLASNPPCYISGNPDPACDTQTGEASAIQQFFNNTVGTGNLTGKWRFKPASRSYLNLTSNQPAENYDAYILGDVTNMGPGFPTSAPPVPGDAINAGPPRSGEGGSSAPPVLNKLGPVMPQGISLAPVTSVMLPNQTITARGEVIIPVKISRIDPAIHGQLQAFQGDFTFDSSVVNFSGSYVQRAGLTAEGNWSLMANVLGTGRIKTLRVSCFALDGGALTGEGTLFELRLRAAASGSRSGASTSLEWSGAPNNVVFFDASLQKQTPASAPPGRITIGSAQGRR